MSRLLVSRAQAVANLLDEEVENVPLDVEWERIARQLAKKDVTENIINLAKERIDNPPVRGGRKGK